MRTVIAGGGPVSLLPPTISGTPEQGQTLTATEGSWSGLAFTAQPTEHTKAPERKMVPVIVR